MTETKIERLRELIRIKTTNYRYGWNQKLEDELDSILNELEHKLA